MKVIYVLLLRGLYRCDARVIVLCALSRYACDSELKCVQKRINLVYILYLTSFDERNVSLLKTHYSDDFDMNL